jgi:acetyl-CoA hydrolase
MGVLSGVRIIEIAGIGPGPFCGMLLADLGADVIVVERPGPAEIPTAGILRRGKRSLALDLKEPGAIDTVLQLIEDADGLIEGMRPGAMERLGLGPEVCLARNPRLAYGRMTGWGQDGPLAQAAGHDNNYIALSGALHYAGAGDVPPVTPPTLVGDLGGGALYLALGLVSAMLHVRGGGKGQVIDAAIVDGSAHMMNLLLDLSAVGLMREQRGTSVLDGPHWFNTYRCKDGRDITVGALEGKFYKLLLEKLGLANDRRFAAQHAAGQWPLQRAAFSELFAMRTRDEWCALLEGSDACFAPVLAPSEAARHPHLKARGTYASEGVLQANAAPRFSGTPAHAAPNAIPGVGKHNEEILAALRRQA